MDPHNPNWMASLVSVIVELMMHLISINPTIIKKKARMLEIWGHYWGLVTELGVDLETSGAFVVIQTSSLMHLKSMQTPFVVMQG